MKFSDLRKKFFIFFVFAGTITLLLIILPFVEIHLKPFVEIYLKDFVTGIFGSPAQEIGATAGEMGATAGSLFVQILRVIKVVLWMSLIISIVRFANFLIFNAAFRP